MMSPSAKMIMLMVVGAGIALIGHPGKIIDKYIVSIVIVDNFNHSPNCLYCLKHDVE